MMNEYWMDIEEYENSYQVSNLGNVRSKERVDAIGHPWHSRILKPFSQKSGYLSVALMDGHGNKTNKLVHRLVAKAFVDKKEQLDVVNHLDEDRTNNKASNLEWCTTKYNLNYGNRSKKQGITQRNNKKLVERLKEFAKSQRKAVIQLTLDGRKVKTWPSVLSTREEGFKVSCVSDCCLGNQKTHHGFKWKYTENI